MLVTHPLLTTRLMQNRGSLAVSFAVSIPMTSPYVSAMARAWSWCSKGNLLNATYVGNARLLGLSGLYPGTQLCNMHVPHFDLKGDNIKALWIASESSLLRNIKPLPTFMQNDTSLPPSSWFRAVIHLIGSVDVGFGPKNFAIKSCSLRRAEHLTFQYPL